jgi:hypothetical protein
VPCPEATRCTSSAANATVQEKISQCEVDSIDTSECPVNLFCEGSSGGLRMGWERGGGRREGCGGGMRWEVEKGREDVSR